MISQNMKKTLLVLCSVILLYFIWWIYNNLEKVEVKDEIRPSFEAEIQPYLALSEFLKKQGYSVNLNTTWSQLSHINPDDSVIVIPYLPSHLAKNIQSDLEKFISQGQVIIGLLPPERSDLFSEKYLEHDAMKSINTHFLKRYNLSIYQEEDNHDGSSTLMNRNIIFDMPNNWMLRETINNKIVNNWSYWLQHEHNQKLVIIPEFSIFENNKIELHDHALFFLTLLQYGDEQQTHNKIWFFTDELTPGFFTLIWQKFSLFIIALVLFTIFLLWFYSIRFGAIYPIFKTRRKELKQHLDAVARWYWNQSKSRVLIQAIDNTIKQKMKTIYPFWDSYNSSKQIQLIAYQCGIQPSKVATTLNHLDVHSKHEFFKLIQQLQTIRKNL